MAQKDHAKLVYRFGNRSCLCKPVQVELFIPFFSGTRAFQNSSSTEDLPYLFTDIPRQRGGPFCSFFRILRLEPDDMTSLAFRPHRIHITTSADYLCKQRERKQPGNNSLFSFLNLEGLF